jgi:predicted protein tyrosine phosphatase
MKFEILPFHELQNFEDATRLFHVVIQFRTPTRNYPDIKYSAYCAGQLIINCHDLEEPMTHFNAKVIKDYPSFFVGPLTIFNSDLAKGILDFAENWKSRVELIVCQCDAGISRSSAAAAALSKIINGDDSWVFNSPKYVPNNLIYRTLINIWFSEKIRND